MLAMIGCVDLDDCGNDLRVIFQFNRQLQADPNHPVAALTSQSEQSSGSEGGDASQDQRPFVSKNLKREPAILAKLNHPNISLHKVVSVGDFHCLVLLSPSTARLGGRFVKFGGNDGQ